MKLKRLISILEVVVISTALAMMSPVSAQSNVGIGGGAGFVSGSEFPFIAGIDSSITSAFFVQNTGTEEFELEFIYGAPDGIEITPSEGQDTILRPGQTTDFRFDLSVSSIVPAGKYPITVNLRKKPDDEPAAGTTYVPALAGRLVVNVAGASATANISVVSELTGQPASGNLGLFYLAENGIETLVRETEQSEFSIDLVPGNYRLTFDIPNLQRQSKEFTIEDGDNLDVVLEIPTLDFTGLSAIAERDERDVIQFVNLSMQVFNNLRSLDGPIQLFTRVYANDELKEEFTLATIPTLPEGETLQRAVYGPDGGFEQGEWRFEFGVRGENFEVLSPQIPRVNSPGLLQSYLQEILIAVAFLLVIALAMPRSWWLVIFRRKKSDEEDKPKPVKKAKAAAKPKTEELALKAVKPTKKPVRKVEKPQITVPEIKTPKLPSIDVSFVGDGLSKISKGFSGILASLAGVFSFQSKDPFQKLLDLTREREALEDEGIRMLAFKQEMSKFSVSSLANKNSGKPAESELTAEELAKVNRYNELKNKIVALETPELKSQVRRALVDEKLEKRTKQVAK